MTHTEMFQQLLPAYRDMEHRGAVELHELSSNDPLSFQASGCAVELLRGDPTLCVPILSPLRDPPLTELMNADFRAS